MNIEATIKNIFIKIAKRLNLELVKKTDSKTKFNESGLNPTAIGANVVANIAIDDSDVVIDGNSLRADAIRKIKDYYTDEIQTPVAEVSLGTGDAIVRPYTDGKNIGLNIIGNDSFIVTESIGPLIKGVIMKLDEYEKDNKTYRLFESQTLKDIDELSVVYIRRFAYEGDKEVSIFITKWSDMPEEAIISSNQLLIGRYKCPTLNRENYNSVNGVPITFGNEEIVENVKVKYKQYNEEFDRKQNKTFADKSLFKKDKDREGATQYTLRDKEFVTVRGDLNNGIKDLIEDYSPAIRETEFQAANNFNLSVLEMCCGFSRGIFTTPETAFATATELKNSLKKTFSFVKRFRKRIELGDRMLFNAINVLMNVNGITPIGEWDIRHDWSYDYIEETKERFNQLLQLHNQNVITDAELRSWGMDEDLETAEDNVQKIKVENPPMEM